MLKPKQGFDGIYHLGPPKLCLVKSHPLNRCIRTAGTCWRLCFNICPLTVLHYGAVSNADPVLMLSSTFGLPEGCCSPQVTDQAENGVAVSVPGHTKVTRVLACLSHRFEETERFERCRLLTYSRPIGCGALLATSSTSNYRSIDKPQQTHGNAVDNFLSLQRLN